VVCEGDALLKNQYGVMAVNPQRHSHVNYSEAMEFVNWLISRDGQDAIGSFNDTHGTTLFVPNAN